MGFFCSVLFLIYGAGMVQCSLPELGLHNSCCLDSILVGVTVGYVPKKVSDADRKRIADLEKSEAMLKEEVSKLKVRCKAFLKIISVFFKLVVNQDENFQEYYLLLHYI